MGKVYYDASMSLDGFITAEDRSERQERQRPGILVRALMTECRTDSGTRLILETLINC